MPGPTSTLLLSSIVIYASTTIVPRYASYLKFLLAITWVFYFFFSVFIYPFYFSPFRDLPEPKSEGILWAHAESIRKSTNGVPFREWSKTVPNDGLMRIRVLLNQERLFATSPEVLKEMLVTKSYDFIKPPEASSMFRELLGNGVLVAEGNDHRHQRRALLPAFSFRHIKDLYPLFWEKARQSTEAIARANIANATSDLPKPQRAYEWASRTTLDIIGEAGMGYDFDAVNNPDGDLVRKYRELFENEPPQFNWIVLGIPIPLPVHLLFKLPLPVFREAKKAVEHIKAFAYESVRQKRADLEKEVPSQIDILSVAMRSSQFTDSEVVDQMMTFLAAGHETTASALTWAMYMLCIHPDIQSKLRDEIRTKLPSISSTESSITAAEIDDLPLLNAVAREVLRLMTSVPMSMREAAVDTTINGRFIPKGTRIYLAPWATNVDFELWGEDALEFKPERWIGKGKSNSGGVKNNYANLTFLHGPRSCIGQDFARSELLCLLAAWVGKFEVSWTDGKPLPSDIVGWVTIKPDHELPVQFKALDGW